MASVVTLILHDDFQFTAIDIWQLWKVNGGEGRVDDENFDKLSMLKVYGEKSCNRRSE